MTYVTLQAQFVLDVRNEIIFQNSKYLSVEITGARKEMEDYLHNEKAGREETAAKTITNEFLQLLQHAKKRGLSAQDSFSHFDLTKSGYIDTSLLMDGLARLGIAAVRPVVSLVLQNIAGLGSTFITVHDFERFISSPAPAPSLAMDDNSTIASANSRSVRSTKSKTRFATASTGSPNDSVSSKRRKQSAVLSQEWTAASPMSASSAGRSRNTLPPIKQSTDGMHRASSAISFSKTVMSGSASTTGSNAEVESFPSKPPRSVSNPTELPPWTSKRHKRALKELRRTQLKWQQKEDQRVHAWEASDDVNGDLPTSLKASASGPINSVSEDMSDDGMGSTSGDAFSRQSSSTNLTTASNRKMHLSLQGISQEMAPELADSPDDLLHVEGGALMTYRVVCGRLSMAPGDDVELHSAALKHKKMLKSKLQKMGATTDNNSAVGSTTSQLSDNYNTQSNVTDGFVGAEGSAKTRGDNDGTEKRYKNDSFTLIIVPDLFSTLESIQSHFEPLLTKYPRARLVLVGLPGLPNTHWPRGSVLGSALYIRCILSLITYLAEKEIFFSHPDDPVMFMGIGTGAYFLSQFIATKLSELPAIQRVVRAIILVNGFMKISKTLRRIWRELQEAMLTAGSHEMNNLVASLHFWDDYLAREGRDEVLERFWKCRRGLCSQEISGGAGYTGVLEILKGLLLSTDFEADETQIQLLRSRIPLLFIHGTEDIFVDPRHAINVPLHLLPPGRVPVDAIENSVQPGALHTCWLKGGHELVQERTSYLLAVISKLAQQCGAMPMTYDENDGSNTNEEKSPLQPDTYDMEYLINLRKEEKAKRLKAEEEEAALLKSLQDKVESDNKEIMEVTDIPEPAEMKSNTSNDDELYLKKLQEQLAEEEKNRQEKRRKEKEKRAKALQDRRKRNSENDRRAELDRLYEMQRLEIQRKIESKEREKMSKEDERSMFAEEYIRECESAENSAVIAKRKAKELFLARREEAIRRVEEQMARQRIERLEERRKRAEELSKQIEKDMLDFPGLREGGYEVKNVNDVLGSLAAIQRLLRDLLECKQKLIETIKRQTLIQRKFDSSRNQCEVIENELLKLRRTLRVIETNPLLKQMGASEEDIESLRRSVKKKDDVLQEQYDIWRNRESQLRGVNRCCSLLKRGCVERTLLMASHMSRLEQLEESLTKSIRESRLEKDLLISKQDMAANKVKQMSKRVKQLVEERKRIHHVKAEYVDTDVWVEGVLQRCKTKDLRDYLKLEQEKAQNLLADYEKQVEELREKSLYLNEKQSKMERDCYKVSQTIKIFRKSLSRIEGQSVTVLAKELMDQQVSKLVDIKYFR